MIKLWRKIFKSLKRSEKRFLFLITAIILFLTLIPLILGFVLTPKGQFYTNVGYAGGADKMVYLSQIEEARQGNVRLHNLYTAEPQEAKLFSPLWLALGQFSRLTNLAPLFTFHLFRLAFGFILLLLLYLFIARIFKQVKWRKIAFLILAFGSGLGFFTVGADWNEAFLFEHVGVDLWASESNTFLTLAHSPLFILSQILILVFFWWLIERLGEAKWGEAVLMGLLVLLLGIIHPYDLFIIFPVTAGWFLMKSIRLKKWVNRIFLKLLAIGLIASLSAAYFFWLKASSRAFADWLVQNVTLSPGLVNYFVGYGLIFIFYLLAIFKTAKSKNRYLFFLSIWSIIGWFLIMSPLQVQRRLINGFHPPLAILGVVGLYYLSGKLRRTAFNGSYFLKSAAIQLTAVLLIGSNLLFLGVESVLIAWDRYPIYISQEDYRAILWFKDNVQKEEVILSSAPSGNLIPAYSGRKVFIGHGHQTSDWQDKLNYLNNFFFATNEDDEQKKDWLLSQKIDYLFYGFYERSLGGFKPEEKDYLRPVWQQGQAAIYRVIGTPSD